jgi:hypothetical protein
MKRRIVLMGFAIPIICSLFVAAPNYGAAQGTKLAQKFTSRRRPWVRSRSKEELST